MSKSNASELVRGAGFAADVWSRLSQEVVAQGGESEDLHLLASKEGLSLIKMIASQLVKAGAVLRNVYPVMVAREDQDTYEKQFDRLLTMGRYEYKHPKITHEYFPGECISTFHGVLYPLNREMIIDDVESELAGMGLRVATMIELLAFGVMFPDAQQENQIVALGSRRFMDSYSVVGCLEYRRGVRAIELRHRMTDWNAFARFLAVRQIEPAP